MCRQIKPLAGPLAGPLASCCRRRRFFVLFCFVLFFCASFSFTRSGTQTNKQTLLKKREEKKQIYRNRIFSYMHLAIHVLQETL